MNRDMIVKKIKKSLPVIMNYGVKKIGIFGSAARDEMSSGSDIDVIVEFHEKMITLSNYMNLKRFLEKLLNCDIDLVIKDTIKPIIKEDILMDAFYVA